MIDARISQLRQWMKEHSIDAVIIPSQDPHQSEYVPDRYKGREWISAFTGSAGTAMVTLDHAGVWTDARYFLQAEEELASSEFVLHKLQVQNMPEYITWMHKHLPEGATIAMDGNVLSHKQHGFYLKHFAKSKFEFRYDMDPLAEIWPDRKGWPGDAVYTHDVAFAGKSRADKLSEIQDAMREQKASWHLVTPLDAVAWTLNLRGSDVKCNPVFMAYLLIGLEKSFLFVDESKLPAEIKTALAQDRVEIRPYDDIERALGALDATDTVLIDPQYVCIKHSNLLSKEQLLIGKTIPMWNKAIKNDTEIQHFRDVMPKDGVAIFRTMRWLHASLAAGEEVREHDVSLKLAENRAAMGNYVGESFDAIVGYKGNGAIIHHKPPTEGSAQIKPEGMLLIDSGGQYLDGTTDITRTFHLSEPSAEEKKAYTLVLKGHIALAKAKFPKGTRGIQLDTLARMHLWSAGLNYLHGTGHGVGFFMNVHEAPQGFANSLGERGTTVMQPGMVSSNEPGYYKDGAFGIRIENLVVCNEDADGFLSFEDLTVYPMEAKLIDESLLESAEIAWLKDYHETVYAKMSPLCTAEEKEELKVACGL